MSTGTYFYSNLLHAIRRGIYGNSFSFPGEFCEFVLSIKQDARLFSSLILITFGLRLIFSLTYVNLVKPKFIVLWFSDRALLYNNYITIQYIRSFYL